MTKSTRTKIGLAAFLMLGLGLMLAPTEGVAQYRYLCTSIPDACEHTGPDAPTLNADVCWGRTTGVQLMSSTSCPSGTWPYHVTHGEIVNPITNQVAAYAPLDNACDVPGTCNDYTPHTDGWESTICCVWYNECYEGVQCDGVLFWCFDGVSNLDGTVTCFDSEEL